MLRSARLPTQNTQKGQALVLAIALFAVAGVVLFMMFNSGRAVNEKINLVNAADAAAYSGAQVAARNLNFMAYTNRAMIANEVAIGHLFTYELEMDLLGQVFDEGFNGSGQLGGFVSSLYSQLFPFFTQTAGDLWMDFVMNASEWIAGMMIVLYDNNNQRYSGFQDQAFRDLVAANRQGETVVNHTMLAIAQSYQNQAQTPISVNDPDTILAFEADDSVDQAVRDSISAAGSMNQQICEMILFANPSGPGSTLATDVDRAAFCTALSNGGAYNNPSATVDNGGLIAAIEATYQNPENYTGGLWINDRNIASYALAADGQSYGTASRTGQTTFEFRNGQMNWVAQNDSLTLNMDTTHTFDFSGDASTTIQSFANSMNFVTVSILNLLGMCNNGVISCSDLRQAEYNSVQRYAVLNSNRQNAVVTAFLEQDNCSDGIGRDENGNVQDGWKDNMATLDEQRDFCAETVYALAKAEIYYERPDCYAANAAACAGNVVGFQQMELADGTPVRERANLFNPFWQVRLIQ